jgi:asparagine synthase (glutamine-hydrolysing)
MAHSVEGRVPFLDHRLVELVYGIDAGALYQAGVTKRLLRRALGDLLPAPVRDRTDKLGFVTPESRFFQGALGAFAEDVFRSKEFRERGLVDSGEALRRLDARRNGTAGGFELWRALSVELWARTCLDGPP